MKKGETAMKHARAWVDINYPGSLLIEAKPRISWIPVADGKRMPRSVEEDIWGVFDLLVFPPGSEWTPTCSDSELVHCLQITTLRDSVSAASARKRKVAAWIHDDLLDVRPWWIGRVLVMGWVPRKHFRVWEWSWFPLDAGWKELEPCAAPLPRKERRTDDPSPPSDEAADRRSTRTTPSSRSDDHSTLSD